MEQLKQEIEDTKSDFEKEKLQDRVAKLCDGVALIKVMYSIGAVTVMRLPSGWWI